jgi:pimeloyl-ACP methyl ester carboxylesterase
MFRSFSVGLFCAVAGWLLGAAAHAAPAGGSAAAPLVPPEPPRSVAEGHLRRAREIVAAAREFDTDCEWRAVDAYYAACQEAWNAVWTCPAAHDLLCEASLTYAEALERLLDSARRHRRLTPRGLIVGPRWRPVCVPIQLRGMTFGPEAVQEIEPCCPPDDSRVSRRHVRGGFGLPVVVRTGPASAGDPACRFAPRRQSVAATAVLRFAHPGAETPLERFAGPLALDHAPAVLDLANPVEIAAVRIGPARPLLGADFTAPLLDTLEATPRDAIREFLQPFGGGDSQARLEFLEPHVRGRIPVVFIHGLASDEGTWFDMLNDLLARPEFRRRFEPWIFHYPTGASFLQSSVVLRRELAAAIRLVDPRGDDPAAGAVVVVGHSMGGLHAKLLVVDPGTALWDSIACVPFAEVRLRPEVRAAVAPRYFFKPAPCVKRVVFIATPHGGSTLATLGVGRVASLAVRQPPENQALHEEAVRDNPGAFRPDYERRIPTTVDVLEPQSASLAAIRGMRIPAWVTTHSIIGDAHASMISGPGDGVVPVSSARHPGVASELLVSAIHTRVHHHPDTIRELERILGEHFRETGIPEPARPRGAR